jgi:HNH endonuclease/Domain of unknown function (DUF222)
LHAQTDSAEGALVDKALAAATHTLFQARHGNAADDAEGVISTIDALVHLARVALDAMDPATRHQPGRLPSPRYVVNIHLPADHPNGARLHLGPVLPAALRQELSCDGLVRAWWRDGTGTVNLGRIARVASPQLRTVIEHRDNGCRIPGCDRSRWLIIHHIIHWEDGGRTDTDNLIAVCPAHHRAVHRGEITITGNADRHLTIRDQRGRPIGPAPPRPPTMPLADAADQLDLHPNWNNRAGERAQWRWLDFSQPPNQRLN